MRKAAQPKDNPADLINVALEELVRARCELPGYTTLDAMASSIRAAVSTGFFQVVAGRLDASCGRPGRRLRDPRQPGHRVVPVRRHRRVHARQAPLGLASVRPSCTDTTSPWWWRAPRRLLIQLDRHQISARRGAII
ncbi:DUF4158 domain-containing protein [Nonomuraea thailandensis]|uniref:DUF4158 domain-containing protein n=1 Tax=Nonomuraea thailandensis TaxID=1188745 RepID=UPI0035585FB3